jgi:hypothetical protein
MHFYNQLDDKYKQMVAPIPEPLPDDVITIDTDPTQRVSQLLDIEQKIYHYAIAFENFSESLFMAYKQFSSLSQA